MWVKAEAWQGLQTWPPSGPQSHEPPHFLRQHQPSGLRKLHQLPNALWGSMFLGLVEHSGLPLTQKVAFVP